MKRAGRITFILAVIAEVICCGFLNIMGGAAFLSYEPYAKCGYALFISTALLAAALVTAGYKKVIIPLILNIAGSGAYIYVLSFLSAIPDTKIPRESVEKLMAKHYPTVAVTVLLMLLVFFNFMREEAVKKRSDAKKAKKAAMNRQLSDDEKIV